jgi:hypothetical protein
MTYILTYEFEDQKKEIEIEIDYSSYFDGIGHYEYWGSKEYDKGHLCIDLDKIEYNKNGLLSEEISIIEAEILNKESEIINACLEDIKDQKEIAAEREYDDWKDRMNY